MALELLAGASLGVVFNEFYKEVKDRIEQTIEFKPLPRLETTLRKIEPVFTEITASSKVLNRPDELTATFTSLLENGKELLVECLSVGEWSLLEKQNYANKLIHFDDELLRFFQIDLQAILLSSNLRILSGVNGLVDRGGSSGFSGCCSVPGLPEFTIGLDQHVEELKCMLLKDETRVLAVSAPEGFGKTTLVKKLCHDDHIKGIFGDNILYVTVSTETSLKSIARNLFKHYDINDFDFTSEEDAKNQIENLIKQKGSGKMLLVLDDVWPSTASVIQDLKFQLPGYKILVTTRFSFPQCDSMYKLSFLKPEYAKPLFCRSVFPSDQNPMYNVRDDFVNRVVEFCKGIPLALTVVGASLRGQAEDTWISTLKMWEAQSISESNEWLVRRYFVALALSRYCFLDTGLFPEVELITGTTLMDMWVELCKFDDEGVYAAGKLVDLKLGNLINLVRNKKAAEEIEGQCSWSCVTQHVLRYLAIQLNKHEPKAEHKRLYMEIRGNKFPEWWTRVTQQHINTRFLSVSTDEECSSSWYDLNALNFEVLISIIRSENYTLPRFIKQMSPTKGYNLLNGAILSRYGPGLMDRFVSVRC